MEQSIRTARSVNMREYVCVVSQGSVLVLGYCREPWERFRDTDGTVSWK